MKHRKLLEMEDLGITDEIRETAYKDQGEERGEEGNWRGIYSYYKYHSYLRAGKQNGILKVEIYRGEDIRKLNEEPVFMIFLSSKENKYTTYLPKEKKWSRAKIRNLPLGSYDYKKVYGQSFWITDEEEKMILKYLGFNEPEPRRSVTWAINDWQTTVMHRKEIQEIDHVMDQVTETPADFGQWVRDEAFWKKQYIFYNASKGEAYCTACRKTIKTKMKSVHNKQVECPKCGRIVTAKSWKKQKTIDDNETAALIQKISDGYIIRFFECRKINRLQEKWREQVIFWEYGRTQLDKRMRFVRDYDYGNFKQTGQDRWCRSNYVNHYSCAVVYPRNLEMLRKSTRLIDIPLEKMLEREKEHRVRIENLLHPDKGVGYLIHAGLTRMAMEYIESQRIVNKNAKDAQGAMGIDRNRICRLKELNGGMRVLEWLRYEQKTGRKLSQKLLVRLDRMQISQKDLKDIMQYGITPEKALNYIEKQPEGKNAVLTEWKDYLDMAKKEHMDTTDDIVRYPKNLRRRHNELADLRNKKKEKERAKQYSLIDQKIRKLLPRVARYYWEDKEYMIVPAAKCEELMREGRILHHCVGASSRYMEKMAAGESWILFLRRKDSLEDPYYTVEIDMKTDEILQWYSEYDRKPDREKIQKVLGRFKKSLNKEKVTA